MKKNIIIIGSGGHALACIEIIENLNKYKIAGLIDNKLKIGTKVHNYKVIGSDKDLLKLFKFYKYALIGIGQIKSHKIRYNIFKKLKKIGYKLPTIIAKNAYISKRSVIGEGTIIMNNVLINAGSEIGDNCIVNNFSLVEHNCKVLNNCHISTSVTLNGDVKINENCFIGSKSVIKNGYELKSNQIIPMGSRIS